jgi:hypothetical protein
MISLSTTQLEFNASLAHDGHSVIYQASFALMCMAERPLGSLGLCSLKAGRLETAGADIRGVVLKMCFYSTPSAASAIHG